MPTYYTWVTSTRTRAELRRLAARTGAIVVHYGDASFTERALDSIALGGLQPGVVLVVDNGPGTFIRARQDPALVVVRPGRNLGFAGGVNLGLGKLAEFGVELVWLLNNDAYPEVDALEALLEAVAGHERALVSSVVLDDQTRQVWFERGVYFPWRLEGRHIGIPDVASEDADLTERTSWRSVPYLSGCSLLVPTLFLRMCGDLDESFFMYGEDVDLSIRAARASYRLVVARGSRVWHTPSSGSNPAARERMIAGTSLRITARYFPALLGPALLVGLTTGIKRALEHRQWWWFASRARGYADSVWDALARPKQVRAGVDRRRSTRRGRNRAD